MHGARRSNVFEHFWVLDYWVSKESTGHLINKFADFCARFSNMEQLKK